MKLFFSTFWILSATLLYAQDTSQYLVQPARVEFEIGSSSVEHFVINGREKGLLVAERTTESSQGGYTWNLNALDTDLEIVWEKQLVIPFDYTFEGYAASDGYYYLLFRPSSFTSKELALFEIEVDSGDHFLKMMNTAFRVELSEFEVIDRTAILGGITDFKPVIITYDLTDKPNPRVVPGIFGSGEALLDLRLDRDVGLFSVITEIRIEKKYKTLNVRTFTTDNQLVQQNLIETNHPERRLNSVATSKFQSGFQYVAGTYGSRRSTYSEGFYIAMFVGGQQRFIKYFSFADLDNFWSYLPEKKERRIRRKAERKLRKGKEPKISQRMQMHEIVQLNDQYILVGEAFYRRRVEQPRHGYTGADALLRSRIVETLEFSHAVAIGFDQNGELLWDHSFGLGEAVSESLGEFVTVNILNDRVELMYIDENLINSKIVDNNEVVEDKKSTPLRLLSEQDDFGSRDPEYEELDNWYGEAFIAYGEHRLVKEGADLNSRRVFYINKLQYKIDDSSK